MLPLLKFEIQKINFVMLTLLNLAALVLGYVTNQNLGEMMFFIVPLFITISTIMSNLFGDLTLKNDTFICSLPISRNEFVASKYMIPLIILLIELCIVLILAVISKYIGIISIELNTGYLYRLFVVLFLLISLLFPIFLSIRSTKIISWLNIIVYALILVSTKLIIFVHDIVLSQTGINLADLITNTFAKCILLFVVICCYIFSYVVSSKKYRNKDI